MQGRSIPTMGTKVTLRYCPQYKNFVAHFLLTGSNTDTPATATAMAPKMTPPARTLRSRFFNEEETPGWAASAISGKTAAARRATEVAPAMFCSLALKQRHREERERRWISHNLRDSYAWTYLITTLLLLLTKSLGAALALAAVTFLDRRAEGARAADVHAQAAMASVLDGWKGGEDERDERDLLLWETESWKARQTTTASKMVHRVDSQGRIRARWQIAIRSGDEL